MSDKVDYLARAEKAMAEGTSAFHEIMGEAFDKQADIVATQHAIVKYAEAMAQVLAQAALASEKAGAGRADFALTQWLNVIRNRAGQLLREAKNAVDSGVGISVDKA